jgi:hypothetical protein
MSLKFFILLLACITGLSACQTTTVKIGEGPIRLLPTRIALFEKYKEQDSPSYFALSSDGRSSSYTYCSPASLNCNDDAGAKALSLCDARAKQRGDECSIFAVNGKIVWKGNIAYGSTRGKYSVIVTLYEFKGSTKSATGYGYVSNDTDIIQLRTKTCIGDTNLRTRTWTVSRCTSGRNVSASGTLEKGAGKRAYFGIGRDSRGETIEISLYDTAGYSATTNPAPISSVNKVQRTLHGSWEGVSENITGSFTTDNSRRTGKIDLEVDQPSTRCKGKWSLTKGAYNQQTKPQGVWSLACNDNISASGTFLSEKRGQGTITGEDNKKQKINMTYN